MTGKWRYRKTMLGNLVLQVEIHTGRRHHRIAGAASTSWRNAKEDDLGVLKIMMDRLKRMSMTGEPPANHD